LGEVEILERFFEAVKGREKAWLLIRCVVKGDEGEGMGQIFGKFGEGR
jgi:hypothetical protein